MTNQYLKHSFFISLLLILIFPQQILLQTIQGTPSYVPWTYTNIDAVDLSLSPSGNLFIIGTDNLIYSLDPHTFQYTPLPIQPPSTPLTITTYGDDIPFITTTCQKIFFLSPTSPFPEWIQLPGCASHISISSKGDIWKTGCDSSIKPLGTFEISKLVCNNKQVLTSFIKDESYDKENIEKELKKNCEWMPIEGEAISVVVDNTSEKDVLYAIVYDGKVMKYVNGSWVIVYHGKAIDIDISNEGILFIVDNQGQVLRNLSEELDTWMMLEGRARKISVGPYSLPAIISWIGNHVKISFA